LDRIVYPTSRVLKRVRDGVASARAESRAELRSRLAGGREMTKDTAPGSQFFRLELMNATDTQEHVVTANMPVNHLEG
jgi:hypothetical protein